MSMSMDKLLIEYIFVPSVLILILLYLVTNAFMRGINLGIKGLVYMAFYILVIYSGWYGFLAPMLYNFAALFLILGIATFFVTRFISPSDMRGLGKFAVSMGERKYDLRVIRDRIIRKDEELKANQKIIDDLREQGRLSASDENMLRIIMNEVEREMKLLEGQLKRGKRLFVFGSESEANRLYGDIEDRLKRVESKLESLEDELRHIRKRLK